MGVELKELIEVISRFRYLELKDECKSRFGYRLSLLSSLSLLSIQILSSNFLNFLP